MSLTRPPHITTQARRPVRAARRARRAGRRRRRGAAVLLAGAGGHVAALPEVRESGERVAACAHSRPQPADGVHVHRCGQGCGAEVGVQAADQRGQGRRLRPVACVRWGRSRGGRFPCGLGEVEAGEDAVARYRLVTRPSTSAARLPLPLPASPTKPCSSACRSSSAPSRGAAGSGARVTGLMRQPVP